MESWNDERLEKVVSMLLISGVSLAAVVVLLGGVCFLWQHGNDHPDYHVFHGVEQQYRSIRGVLEAARPSDCRGVIQLGLILLICTPIARVAFSMLGFLLERDRTYVVLTVIVLAILVYGLVGPH
ncbi:MAG TPA: DUF1634 domain-containing protein [Bryobacteraceae bacterium]|nr:DUF1634 domain-containing protein [Bryobacteraceae bacterium]